MITKTTSKLYMQMWKSFSFKKRLTRQIIWDFQQTFLSSAEIKKSETYALELNKSDPRFKMYEITETAYNQAIW